MTKKYFLDFSDRHNLFEKPHYFMIFISNLFVILCTIVAIALIVFQIIFDNAPVIGQSMYPYLNPTGSNTDRVYINKFATVTYGDVIVLSIDNWDEKEGKNIIKRVIGLEGDKIGFELDEEENIYYLTRNGRRLKEDYLTNLKGNETKYKEFVVNCLNNSAGNDVQEYVVPEGKVFVLGDNRHNSTDSAVKGAFSIEDLWGRVDYITPVNLNLFAFFFKQFFSCGMYQYHA